MLIQRTKQAVLGSGKRHARHADIIVLMYGQSNMLNMSGTAASPAAANAGTSYFDGVSWGAVPAANGVRNLLNTINTVTGKTVGAMNGAVAGVPIARLMKGNGTEFYEAFRTMIARSGSMFDYIIWHQGEGDSAGATTEAAYLAALDNLHSDLCTDFGYTKAKVPLIAAGLGVNTSGENNGYGTNANWDAMERTLLDVGSIANAVYSHSNRDAPLSDNVHWTGAGYGNAGNRYARTITSLRGDTSNNPNWHISSSAVVDATTTTVDLTHVLGTDFTPTSGITGFEVSGDNGATWNTPSAGVRTSATRITLTHTSLATDSNRKLRYQYGLNPDVTGAVLDNSSLTLPLDNSANTLSPTPLATLPVPTFRTSSAMATGVNTATVSQAALNIVNAAANLMLVCTVTEQSGQAVSSATVTPSGGGAISATVVKSDASNGSVSILQFHVPSGTDLTNATLAVTFAGSVFSQPSCAFWTVPESDLSSTTAVDKQTVTSASANALSITNLTTSSGGLVIAVSAQATTTNSCTWTGTESYARRVNTLIGGRFVSDADASGTGAATASSTVTATFTGAAAAMRVTAASWR